MLRIMEESATNNATTLRLDGRLVGPWVEILRASCEQVHGRLILDLAGVSFADHAGVELLRQLEPQQVALVHCSPFLQEQMKRPANYKPAEEPGAHTENSRA
ncbi:MAG: hypothetical protein ACREEM_48530 [Blastocatellia bacterium]